MTLPLILRRLTLLGPAALLLVMRVMRFIHQLH